MSGHCPTCGQAGCSSDHETYYCVVCGKGLPIVDGVIVHDEIPHPIGMSFDEEEKTQ